MAHVVCSSRRFVGFASLSLLLASGSAWAGTVLSSGEAPAQGAPFSFVMTGADIPTLGEWAVLALLLLMGAHAVGRLRKNGALVGAGLGLLLLLVSSGGLLAVGGLAGANHDPATMLGSPQGHSRRVSVNLTADAGQTITGMNVHYRKAGGAWKTATGAAAPTQTCPSCWAGTLDTTGYAVGDTVQYYFEALVGGAPVFAYKDPAAACDAAHFGSDCTGAVTCDVDHGSCAEGSCYGTAGDGHCTACTGNWALPDCTTCTAEYTGADCTTCASGFFLSTGECVDSCEYMNLASGECVDNCCLNQVADPCEPSPYPWIHGTTCLAACPAGTCQSISGFCVDAADLVLDFDPLCSQHGAVDPATCTCACDPGFYGRSCQHDQPDMDHCNAHGTWNAGTGTCTCDQGVFECYTGDACEDSVTCNNQ